MWTGVDSNRDTIYGVSLLVLCPERFFSPVYLRSSIESWETIAKKKYQILVKKMIIGKFSNVYKYTYIYIEYFDWRCFSASSQCYHGVTTCTHNREDGQCLSKYEKMQRGVKFPLITNKNMRNNSKKTTSLGKARISRKFLSARGRLPGPLGLLHSAEVSRHKNFEPDG